LPVNQLHAEPLFHGLDMAPSFTERYINFLRSLVDRTMGIDGLKEKSPAPAEDRFAADFDPYL
jgi:hypothetical protein